MHHSTLNNTTWRFEYSSATPEGQGGIGLLINLRLATLSYSSEKISNRIMMTHFKSNPILPIVVAYAPAIDKNDAEKDIFYEDLQKCTQDVPPHNVVILAGGFNEGIGYDRYTTNLLAIGKFTYHNKTDETGNRSFNCCEACNMRSARTRFPQPKSRS